MAKRSSPRVLVSGMSNPLGLVCLLAMWGCTLGIVSGSPSVGPCAVFPSDNAWNIRVDSLPVASNSETLVRSIGWTRPAHPDFGTGEGLRGTRGKAEAA